MIPRTVHLIWFQGIEHLPPKYQANLRRLRGLNPGWQIRVWSDAELRAAAAALGVAQAYDAATVMHQKIDLGRYCILYIHGGITVDMDTWALQPLDALPGLQAIDRLTVSMAPLNALESATFNLNCVHVPGTNQLCSFINNACLLAPPQDPALMHIIRHCSEKLLNPPTTWGKELLVNETTGPWRITTAIHQLPTGMVTILPHTFFEPCIGSDPYCVLPPEAILAHQHDNTWIASGLQTAGSLWFHVKHYWTLALFLTLALWLLRRR